MLYVDIPTQPEIRALFEARADACVSIYLPTTCPTCLMNWVPLTPLTPLCE
jgi:hypothetical protein